MLGTALLLFVMLSPQEEIYSSSYAAAAYLESIKFNKKVYVIGEEGIQQVWAIAERVLDLAAFCDPRASRCRACA